MGSRGARVARGISAAAVSTLIAAFSHAAGGGSFPSVSLIALVFAFAALACIALAGRSASASGVLLSVLISQAVFHLAFFLPAGSGAVAEPGLIDSHAHHASVAGAAMVPMAVHLTGGMLMAHLFAAAITTVALVWGERVFWGLLDSARLALSSLTRRIAVVAAPSTAAARPMFVAVTSGCAVVLSSLRRRGPPVLALSAD